MSDEPAPQPVADLEAKIEQTRERLSENVDQLTDKLNPKYQARRVADDAKDQAAGVVRTAQDRVAEWRQQGVVWGRQGAAWGQQGFDALRACPQQAAAGAGAVLVAVLGVILLRRRAGR